VALSRPAWLSTGEAVSKPTSGYPAESMRGLRKPLGAVKTIIIQTFTNSLLIPNMSKKKSIQNRSDKSNTALTIAIVGLAGTIITSLFAYLITRTQIELPIQITLTAGSRSLPIDTPSIATQTSRNVGTVTQQATVAVTLSNSSQSTLEITISGVNGVTIGLEIPPGASQTIKLPPDDYSYTYQYVSDLRSLPPGFRGSLHLTTPSELCFSRSSVTLCRSSRSPVFILIAGIAGVALLVLLLVRSRKWTRHQSEITDS
jgi:hypothetical protein